MKTLLDVDYIVENNTPIIRLFYKDSEKGHIVEYVENFYPYFYAVPDNPDNIEKLENEILEINKNIKKIRAIERVKKIDYEDNKEKEILKIYVNVPGDVRDVREIINSLPSCKGIFEYDIPFA
ncbi:MAG: DNA polymerase, partial [Candidatus Altarchaeaceae archaeon]